MAKMSWTNDGVARGPGFATLMKNGFPESERFRESHRWYRFGGCLQCIIDQNADDVNDLGVGTGTFVMVIIDGDNEIFAGGCSIVKFTVQQTG